MPGPRSVTRMRSSCLVALTRTLHGLARGRHPQCVLEHVRRVRAGSGRRRRSPAADRPACVTSTRSAPGQLLECLRDELVRRPELRDGLGAPRLEPREVEKVLDEPLRAGCAPRESSRGAPSRSSSVRSRSPLSSPSRACSIVASGVRRSCETAWITAVLTASLRRSASASSASRASARARAPPPCSEASAGRSGAGSRAPAPRARVCRGSPTCGRRP